MILTYFKIGQTVYCPIYGQGIIIAITNHTIHVQFEQIIYLYNLDGRLYDDGNIILSQKPHEPVINQPISAFEDGELVWVRSVDDHEWLIRYYSHFENGLHYCHPNQKRTGLLPTNWSEIQKFDDNPLI
jgi:hypothetical protein